MNYLMVILFPEYAIESVHGILTHRLESAALFSVYFIANHRSKSASNMQPEIRNKTRSKYHYALGYVKNSDICNANKFADDQ